MARKTKTGEHDCVIGGMWYADGACQFSIDDESFELEIRSGKIKSIRVESLDRVYYTHEYSHIDQNGKAVFADYAINVEMTLRSEKRDGDIYWYAYRRTGGKLNKRYVGKSDMVTNERLLKIAQALPSQPKRL